MSRHISKLISLLLMLAVFLLTCPTLQVRATFQEKLAELQAEQDVLTAQIQSAQAELALFQSEKDLGETQLAWLMDRSEEERQAYEAQLKQITAVTKIKQSLDKNLELSIRKFESRKDLYAKRIESMYRMQNKSQIEILLESRSLPAYFTTLRLMQLISDSDEQELEQLRQERDRLEIQKQDTDQQLADLEEIRKSIEADLKAMQEDLEGYQSRVAQLSDALQEKLAAVDAYAAQDAEIQIGIAAMQEQIERERRIAEEAALSAQQPQEQGGASPLSGGWVWPCPSSSGITSGFGPRCIPEAGINDVHTGLDFAADYDAPVLAATSGVVVCAGAIPYGGNTVKIDIGGGYVIWNCHLNSIAVYEGQYVNAGEVVGYVGSTGMSTGPHLHFEVQQGGIPVDPWLFLG